jgi:hypothetical protein
VKSLGMLSSKKSCQELRKLNKRLRKNVNSNKEESKISREDFQAFQSNLLSLVSHELRTPLTGVLSALNALQDDNVEGSIKVELMAMATRNAEALNQTLMTLLDLGAIESGGFRLKLRELSMARLFSERCEKFRAHLKLKKIDLILRDNLLSLIPDQPNQKSKIALGDPEKISRVADLLFQIAIQWGKTESKLEIKLNSYRVQMKFEIRSDLINNWNECWNEIAQTTSAGSRAKGARLKNSFFSIERDENDFLTRDQEGLGSEVFLVSLIAQLHAGKFSQSRHQETDVIQLEFSVPWIDNRSAVIEVLKSRVFSATHELGVTAVGILRPNEGGSLNEFFGSLESALFRATDSVYLLEAEQVCVVLLEDCKPKDAAGLMARIQAAVGQSFDFGVSFCPSEGANALELLELAQKRLDSKR